MLKAYPWATGANAGPAQLPRRGGFRFSIAAGRGNRMDETVTELTSSGG
jgi:hypothetical protein